jgi:hypothetical protein
MRDILELWKNMFRSNMLYIHNDCFYSLIDKCQYYALWVN